MNTPWANFGKVDNKGVDLSLTFNKQLNKDLYLGLRGTMTYAKNKVIEKDEAPGRLGTNRQETGLPVNQLFGLIAEGLFTEDDFENVEQGILKEGIPTHTFSSRIRPGDIRYRDVDGDGSITDMDEVPLGGTVDPQIVFGFGGNVSYKNIDVNIFFQGNGRTWRFIGGSGFLPGSSMGAMYNIYDNYQDRWTSDNPSQNVFYPRLTYGQNENNLKESTWWLRNMSMLRVKDIEVGYRFPKAWMSKIGVRSLRLYLKGSKSISFGLDVNF